VALIRLLIAYDLVDKNKAREVLGNGSARNWHRCGEESYQTLCRAFHVFPAPLPRNPVVIKHPLHVRVKRNIAKLTREIARQEARIRSVPEGKREA